MRLPLLSYVMKDRDHVTATLRVTQGLVFGALGRPILTPSAPRVSSPKLTGSFLDHGGVSVSGASNVYGGYRRQNRRDRKVFVLPVQERHGNRSSVIHLFSGSEILTTTRCVARRYRLFVSPGSEANLTGAKKVREACTRLETVAALFSTKRARGTFGNTSLDLTGCIRDEGRATWHKSFTSGLMNGVSGSLNLSKEE